MSKTTTPPVHATLTLYPISAAPAVVHKASDPRIEHRDGAAFLVFEVAGKTEAHAVADVARLRVNGSALHWIDAEATVEGPLDLRPYQA